MRIGEGGEKNARINWEKEGGGGGENQSKKKRVGSSGRSLYFRFCWLLERASQRKSLIITKAGYFSATGMQAITLSKKTKSKSLLLLVVVIRVNNDNNQ